MGLLWRLLAPKPAKKMRRTARKVARPHRLLIPKPVKKVRRTAFEVMHPLEAIESAAQNQLVHALKGNGKRSKSRNARQRAVTAPSWIPARITQGWIEANVPTLGSAQRKELVSVMRARNWTDADLRARVYPHLK